MFRWKRTIFEGYPRVYLRFNARDRGSNDLVEYRIQDLPEDRFQDALKFYEDDQYLREEQFARGLGIKDDPDAILEMRGFIQALLHEKISLVCFREGSNEIVALNVLYVLADDEQDLDLPLQSSKMKQVLAIGKYIIQKSIPLEPKGVEFVLEGMGLSVSKNYRQRSIATKMLEARIVLMQNLGLTTTSTIFSGRGSQTAAKKAGYTEYLEVTYDELLAQGHPLNNITEHSVKTLGYQLKN